MNPLSQYRRVFGLTLLEASSEAPPLLKVHRIGYPMVEIVLERAMFERGMKNSQRNLEFQRKNRSSAVWEDSKK